MEQINMLVTNSLRFLPFFALPGLALSQNSYSFDQSTAPYTELVGGTALVPDGQGADIFSELDGETFWFYGLPFTFDANHLIYAFDTGYLIAQNDSSVVAIDGVNQPMEAVDATSTVSYAINGTPGNKELLVQWKNWHMTSGPADNYLSCQIAIDQATGVMEVRYGPNSGSDVVYTDLTGPYCGIAYMPTNFSTCYEKLWVEFNSFDIVLDSVPNFDFDALHNAPPPNTIYRFTPRFSVTGVADVGSAGTGMHAWLSEDGDRLSISLPASAATGTLELFDTMGRCAGRWPVSGASMTLPLQEMSRGSYLLTHTAHGERTGLRFVR
ncbi:MAG: hypothetical protein ABI432_06520 [Flavobacteriales bacterium]